MKIIFAGTPEFAVPALEALIHSSHQVVAVYTQPDSQQGRGKILTASPVKQLALTHHIEVQQPLHFKDETTLTTLRSYQADMMIVAAYGLILPTTVLNSFRFGCINVHASLLPRWRGAAPIQRAIIAGDTKTGISIMQMEKGLDTGPYYIQTTCEILKEDTAETLQDRLANLGARTLIENLENIFKQTHAPITQDESLVTYAHKLEKQEAEIHWNESAEIIERKIRAYNPWPIAFFKLQGETIRVWQALVIGSSNHTTPGTILSADKNGIVAACGKNNLCLTQLQFPGGKRLEVQAILNSRKEWFTPGIVLC